MKIIINLSLLLLICLSVRAQSEKLILRHDGFSGNDSTKHYVVVNAPEMKQDQLYKKTLSYLQGLYKNPKEVINSVEGESITVNALTESIKGDLYWYKYPMYYNLIIQFKDGKIRFEPSITDLKEVWAENKEPRKQYVCDEDSPNKVEINCIWMKQVKSGDYFVFKKDLKASIESWANNYLGGLVKNLSDEW